MKKINIVTIGGGTGSFVLLSGLKKFPVNISAIVSMADDGGSTGVLRDELGVLPPGDVRQCLVALSDSSDVLRRLMNYRFGGSKLKGHSFGNLFLSALEKIEGNFSRGVEEASKILNVRGEVIPVTEDDISLRMELGNGLVLKGEHKIWSSSIIQKHGVKKYYFKPGAKANPQAIQKITGADVVIIGPGSHYGSILPNLLVEGIGKAIRNTKANIIYNCNLVNKKGQTENFELDDYVDLINGFLGGDRVDYVIYNTKKPKKKLIIKYEAQKEELVQFKESSRANRSYKILFADLLSSKFSAYPKNDRISANRSLIRHDSDKLAKAIMEIAGVKKEKSHIFNI